jgi:hypothetical protein
MNERPFRPVVTKMEQRHFRFTIFRQEKEKTDRQSVLKVLFDHLRRKKGE